MNVSDYQNHLATQYQIAKTTAIKHPVREAIQRCVGIYDFTATFEEDIDTIETFQHIPGVVAFICTLRKDSRIIGIGRGSAIINRLNRFVEKAIHIAFNSSLINAIIISTKALDSFHPDANAKTQGTDVGLEGITEKQKSYLLELVRANITDKTELSQWESKIDGLSKNEASESIKLFAR